MKFYKVLNELLENKNSRFIIATDTEYQENYLNSKNEPSTHTLYSKQFSFFDKLKDYETFCNKDNNCYEICKDKNRKIYFDIDNVDLSYDECIEYIEGFIKLVSQLLEVDNDFKQYLIKVNEGERIKSIHIINTKYYMNYEDNKQLSTYINESQKNYIVDLCVYNQNQQFRNVNQSKLSKKIKNKVLNHAYTFKDSLLSYTDKLKKLYFHKIFYIKKDNHIELDTNELMNIITNEDNGNIIFDKTFFNNNNDWKNATIIIKQYKICDMDLWNKLSIENATETYSYEDNEIFIKNINDKMIYGISKLYYIVSKYSNYCITPINKLPFYISNFIEENYNESHNIIELIHNENKDLQNITTKEGNELKLDCYNGFLFCDAEGTETGFRCIGNIFYDNISLNEDKIFKEVQTIEEAKDKLCEFIESDKKIYTLKSVWGTGKTYMIINHTLKHYDDCKILMITESNALNTKLSTEYDFISHLDKQKDKEIDLSICKKVVCSIQSINKIEKNRFDIIIIDEFESVLNAYSSNKTFTNVFTKDRNYNETAYNILLDKIKKCQKCLCLDADIEEQKIKLFIDKFGKEDIVIYKNKQNPYQDYKCVLYNQECVINANLHKDILDNKKVVISWNKSVKQAEELIKLLFVGKTTLFINVEGAFLYKNNKITAKPKQEVIEVIEDFIIANNVDIWIYTPTIKTGISFNKEYFDKCYGYSNNNTLIVKEFTQGLFRVRKLKDKQFNLYLQHFKVFTQNKKVKKNLTINEVKRLFNTNDELYKHINKDKVEDIYTTKNIDTPYYDLQVVNTQNIINSSKCFTYNFMELLIYHNLKYEYRIEPPNKEYDILRDKAFEAIEYYEITLLTNTEYELLKKENQNKYDKYSIEDQIKIKKQYNKTSELRYLYGGYDRIPKYFMGIDLSHYKEDIENFKKTELYEHYDKYIHKKGKDTIKIIRNVLNERIDNNELVNIMEVDNYKLNMLCIHNILLLIKYDYDLEFKLMNAELNEIFKNNYDLINLMYKKFTNEIFSIETNDKGFKEVYKMFKKLLKLININFSYDKNETNTKRKSTNIYIKPYYNCEDKQEDSLYNYEMYKYKTLKLFKNQSTTFIIDKNNTEYMADKKIEKCEQKIINGKRITNEDKEQYINNLLYNERQVYIIPNKKIVKEIKPTYFKSSYYNENLKLINKNEVDKKGFVIKKDKTKIKVYKNVITKWISQEPTQDFIYRAYEPINIKIDTLKYETNVYDMNLLEKEYDLYKGLLLEVKLYEPIPITICN